MRRVDPIVEKEIKGLYLNKLSGFEISKKLNISLAKVYDSLIRQGIARRKSSEQNEIRFRKSPLSFNLKNKLSQKERELLIAAAMLYYGEGAKTGHSVDFANSDPTILRLFIKFLRIICNIDEKRIKLYLYCFSNQNPKELIRYWSRKLNVSISNFTKPYIRNTHNRMQRIMSHGVLHIRYSDKRLFEIILKLIEKISLNLLK